MYILQSGWFWWPLFAMAAIWLAYMAAARLTWFVVATGMLAAFTWIYPGAWWVKAAAWLVFAVPFALLGASPIRRRIISGPVLNSFRLQMPEISDTERQALEAGDVGWESELFAGKPRWRRWFRTRCPRLTAEERAFLDGPVERLCEMLDEHDINSGLNDLPALAWAYIKEQRFFGLTIPPEDGGLGFSEYAHGAVISKIATRSLVGALTVMIPNSVGPAELIRKYGTAGQKKKWLPRLARGDEIPCFALTGRDAGSDASAIPDIGVVCRGRHDGRDGVLGIRLTFEKRYITLAPVATLIALAFRMHDPEKLLGGDEWPGISLALVPAATPGVESGRRHAPLHMGFQNGPLTGRDVFVPIDALIGGPGQAGRGWKMLMESLSTGRAISLPALSVATAKLACRTTGAYARIRYQFGRPIGDFEGVKEALARLAGNTYAMNAARIMTLAAVQAGQSPALSGAIVKYNLTERCRQIINDAMDVHGGAAICLGPHNVIGEYQKFPHIAATVEGANILTRNLVVFGQGILRCHPFLKKEMDAAFAGDPHRGAREFDRLLAGHIRRVASLKLRCAAMTFTGGRLAAVPRTAKSIKRQVRQLSRMSAAFALTTEALLFTERGALKRRENLSARMADALSELYIASSALKLYLEQDEPQGDRPMMEWAVADSLYRIQESLSGVVDNMQPRWLAWSLKRWLFPFGRPYRQPADALSRRIAGILLSPSPTRNRLTDGVFLSNDTSDQLGRLEDALTKTTLTEPLARKLADAERMKLVPAGDPGTQLAAAVNAKVLSSEEASMLRQALEARRAATQADAFQ